MKANIEVASRGEAEAIRSGLADPLTRAIVVVQGVLAGLPSDRARKRVMDFVTDWIAEVEAAKGNNQ